MPPRKKVFYIISHVNKSLGFEWTARELRKYHDLTFVLLNPTDSFLESFLKAMGVRTIRIPYNGKREALKAFVTLCRFFLKDRPDVVHAHLFDATLIGLTSAWVCRIKKRIYTRHNSTYHHEYFRSGIKYDKLSNWLSTHIVSISQATDYALTSLEKVKPEKIRSISHGFDFDDLLNINRDRKYQVMNRWRIPERNPRIGVIARHMEWKGVQYTVSAFKLFLKEHPEAFLVLANAAGPYHPTILNMLADVPAGNYVMIPFEEDVASLYQLFDMFVHVPVDQYCEAFGQTYIEALACKIPSVFTLSGVAAEFVVNQEQALVVEYRNSTSIAEALQLLWSDPSLRARLGNNGYLSVTSHFRLLPMVQKLNLLYDE